MFSNYLKVALRNLFREKGHSFINIAGLSIGMACAILILMWVHDEMSFDKFHEHADRIYRLVRLESEDHSSGIARVGAPWAFGIHQCSYARRWSDEDLLVFATCGRRIADALGTLLVLRDLTDVAFVHGGEDLHLGEVLRENEEHGRLKTRGHRLSHLDIAGDHHSANRSADLGVLEVPFGSVEPDLGVQVVGLGKGELVQLDV